MIFYLELPDNANQCFYEEIVKGTESTIEYQVVTGGQYDVDMMLESPSGQILYKDVKKQYDSHTWKADVSGVYKVSFWSFWRGPFFYLGQ